jgi:DNA-binding GntR family transcriptional regulator
MQDGMQDLAGASLAVRAHAQLREEIVSGRLRPNERLVETELARRLKVSRTPLRESFARLAWEGLIASRRGGWVVREHAPDEVRDIYEVRATLEGMAARLAAEQAGDDERARITALHEDGLASADHPGQVLVAVNDAFHEAIADTAGNRRLHELLGQNRRFFFSYRIAEQYTEEEANASLAGHAEVVHALAARDGEWAERAMRDHIRLAMDVNLGKLR